jgi:secondary thiamine-phosphate synthase enzyme
MEIVMEIIVHSSEKTQLIDITSELRKQIKSAGIKDGICMIYVPHTTAAVTINESADPDVRVDIEAVMDKLVPWEDGYHHLEGNSAAHVKSTLVGVSELVAVKDGRLILGTWQGIFFCEFDGPRTRKVHWHAIP